MKKISEKATGSAFGSWGNGKDYVKYVREIRDESEKRAKSRGL